jgi:hypothetical protein
MLHTQFNLISTPKCSKSDFGSALFKETLSFAEIIQRR